MNQQNKDNLIFLGKWALLALVVFFTVVMLTYVGKKGLWSTPLPLTAIGYGIYCFVKRYLKKKEENEEKKEDAE